MSKAFISESLILSSAAILVIFAILPCDGDEVYSAYGQNGENPNMSVDNETIADEYTVNDPNLKTELVAQDLDYPTTMAFVGQNDILILEKDNGTVRRIINGQILEKPLLDANVSGYGEDGMVGIAVVKGSKGNSTYVYLYFTQSGNDTTYYNYSLDLSAKDVNQLHSKVLYYDSIKKEISWDYIFGGRDRTFKEKFTNAIFPPTETKYVKIQMWIKPTLGKNASYLLDNVRIENMTIQERRWINNDKNNVSISTETNEPISSNGSLRVDIKPAATVEEIANSPWRVISTDFIPVIDVTNYNRSIDLSGDIRSKNKPVGNLLYRYELTNNQLINPKLLLDLPASSEGKHNGGKIVVGPDSNLYITVGDIAGRHFDKYVDTKAQNNKKGPEPDGTGGILRISQSGKPVREGILGNKYPLNLYYAYGIRNSFGMDFDPVTGNLWNTENGRINGDEINLVKPGFNSGWSAVEGMAHVEQKFDINNLVDFNKKGNYSDPEFAWYGNYGAVGPTALIFLNSDKYADEYKNDMFVSDFNHGNIYHFDLNKDRTELSLGGSLTDKIASEDDDSLEKLIFAKAPGAITDLQVGPDGYIYFISLNVKVADCGAKPPGCFVNYAIKGSIHRIVPKN
jgi:glucose/arabinose dehydrogenase